MAGPAGAKSLAYLFGLVAMAVGLAAATRIGPGLRGEGALGEASFVFVPAGLMPAGGCLVIGALAVPRSARTWPVRRRPR
ncbi:hypothetical protein [Spongiactinospora sp. 9N601]|uniref:hypothetical protein n=1 Tax=Spongiactinospora sp. 9N601 TaxID=3375149 RepID=UPI0037A6536D